MPDTPHPWRRLRQAAHITLRWHDFGPMGWCRHSTQEVSLRSDLTQSERRATLAHELEHLLTGPAIMGFEDQDEREVTQRSVRWLIPLEALAEAMVWANGDHELADVLWVDLATVQARLVHLTAEESRFLNEYLDRAELGFPR